MVFGKKMQSLYTAWVRHSGARTRRKKVGRVFALLLAVCLVMAMAGCDKGGKAAEGNAALIEKTYKAAEDLNGSSYFNARKLLADPPEGAVVPGPNILNDPRDYFTIYPYDGKERITQFSLSTPAVNVWGIKVGDKLSAAEAMLTKNSYAESEEGDEAVAGEVDPIFVRKFVSAHITVAVDYLADKSGSDGVIKKIVVTVTNPEENS